MIRIGHSIGRVRHAWGIAMRVAGTCALALLPLFVPPSALQAQRPADTKVVWPAPPETPRVRYVGVLQSELDIGAHGSKLAALRRQITGETETVVMLGRPHDVLVDRRGRFWVSDMGARQLVVFDPGRRKVSLVGDTLDVPILSPMGLASDGAGGVYVADALNHRVLVFDEATGNLRRILGGPRVMLNPVDVAIDAKRSRVYVVDSFLHQVLILDPSGTLLGRIGRNTQGAPEAVFAAARRMDNQPRGHGSGDPHYGAAAPSTEPPQSIDITDHRSSEDGEFRFPGFVAVAPDGTIYVSDGMNFRIQAFDADGRFLRRFGEVGDVTGSFTRPKGIAVDSEGHVYVVDAAFNNIQIFDPCGQLLLAFPGARSPAGTLNMPMGIFIDPRDRIYVASKYGGDVQIYQFLHAGSH